LVDPGQVDPASAAAVLGDVAPAEAACTRRSAGLELPDTPAEAEAAYTPPAAQPELPDTQAEEVTLASEEETLASEEEAPSSASACHKRVAPAAVGPPPRRFLP